MIQVQQAAKHFIFFLGKLNEQKSTTEYPPNAHSCTFDFLYNKFFSSNITEALKAMIKH